MDDAFLVRIIKRARGLPQVPEMDSLSSGAAVNNCSRSGPFTSSMKMHARVLAIAKMLYSNPHR